LTVVPDSETSQFLTLKARYFGRLCEALALRPRTDNVGTGFATASADRGDLRVYFEYERGLSLFSVGAVNDGAPACSVENVADRFPRVRVLEGDQRLSLEEQYEFLVAHWSELEFMFSPDGIDATRAWLAAKRAALMARYSGDI
jgi:hypothetical protein